MGVKREAKWTATYFGVQSQKGTPHQSTWGRTYSRLPGRFAWFADFIFNAPGSMLDFGGPLKGEYSDISFSFQMRGLMQGVLLNLPFFQDPTPFPFVRTGLGHFSDKQTVIKQWLFFCQSTQEVSFGDMKSAHILHLDPPFVCLLGSLSSCRVPIPVGLGLQRQQPMGHQLPRLAAGGLQVPEVPRPKRALRIRGTTKKNARAALRWKGAWHWTPYLSKPLGPRIGRLVAN